MLDISLRDILFLIILIVVLLRERINERSLISLIKEWLNQNNRRE